MSAVDENISEKVSLPAICQELGVRASGTMPVVNSRDVAEMFGKEHRNVLRDIEAIFASSDLSAQNWFRPVEYVGEKGGARRSFDLTRQGFTLLVMGWTGQKAIQFKVRYIEAFDAMEAALRAAHNGQLPEIIDQRLEAVEKQLEGISYKLVENERRAGERHMDLVRGQKELSERQRKPLSKRVRDEHLWAVNQLYHGRCPCCNETKIVSYGKLVQDEGGKAVGEFDHYRAVGNPAVDATWLICRGCHKDISDEVKARHLYDRLFGAYHDRRDMHKERRSLKAGAVPVQHGFFGDLPVQRKDEQ